MILVTGTTGGLGCHILKHLLGDPLVVRVFAYNKSSSSVEAQRAAFVQNGLNVELLDSYKLRFVFGDMHEPLLGLTVPAYKEVCVFPAFCDPDLAERDLRRYKRVSRISYITVR